MKKLMFQFVVGCVILCGVNGFVECNEKEVPKRVMNYAKETLGELYHPLHIEMRRISRRNASPPGDSIWTPIEYTREGFIREYMEYDTEFLSPLVGVKFFKFDIYELAGRGEPNIIAASKDSVWLFSSHMNDRVGEAFGGNDLKTHTNNVSLLLTQFECHDFSDVSALRLVEFTLESAKYINYQVPRVLTDWSDITPLKEFWPDTINLAKDSILNSLRAPFAIPCERGYDVIVYWLSYDNSIHRTDFLVERTVISVRTDDILGKRGVFEFSF